MSEKTLKMLGVDLGASSGRGIIGSYDGEKLELSEIHRFENNPLTLEDGTLCWDIAALRENVCEAVRLGDAAGAVSVGVDTWGVDYGLLDSDGNLMGSPVHYRDRRTEGITDHFKKLMPLERLYGISGIQSMDFNTVYQLAAEKRDKPERLEKAASLLFMPDLFNYFLTGRQACEYTIASTGALLDARTRDFSPEILDAIGVKRDLFAPLVQSGNVLGTVLPELGGKMKLVNTASHDTASAVLAVPTDKGPGDFIYISSGTWSLMGTELTAPQINDDGRLLNWTNEGGAYGTIRFLKNIMGLWLLQESRRQWAREGHKISFDELSDAARTAVPFASLIDPNDPSFSAPGDMPRRIADYCRRTGQPVPETPGGIVRVIFDSLALCYRYTAESAAVLTGRSPRAVNIVGGGSKDNALNALTADVTGLPVIAGPSEATAVGNLLMQLIAAGEVGDIVQGRELVRRSFDTRTFMPDPDRGIYDEAYARYVGLLKKGGEE